MINLMIVIVSVLFLISLFLVIAVNLIFIGLHFLSLAYLLLYIGAIAILFLFTIMLLNIRVSELTSYYSNSFPLALIFGVIIFNIISGAFSYETGSTGLLMEDSLGIDLSSSYK